MGVSQWKIKDPTQGQGDGGQTLMFSRLKMWLITGSLKSQAALLNRRPDFLGGLTSQAALIHGWPYFTGDPEANLNRRSYFTGSLHMR